jgi:integrase
MTEFNSIQQPAIRKPRRRKAKKPDKPYPEFPLFAHATKRWAKKIRGKLHYFGPWADPDGALKKYLEQRDALHAGLVPRSAQPAGFTIRDLCNRFLTSKRHQLDTSELSPRTFAEYYAACELIVKTFGKDRLVEDLRPEDFERFKVGMPSTWGPGRRGKFVQMVRSIFRYAVDEDLVEKTIKFGKQFKKPSSKTMRLHRAKAGKRMFEAHEVREILNKAGLQLKAMILLAVNCGFGNNDVSSLPMKALELETSWVNFPRPKTGVDRRCKLWPETVAAIREATAKRPAPKDKTNAGLVFLTKYGTPWVKVTTEKQEDGTLKVKCDDAVSKEMKKVMKALKIDGHRNFYTLRHTFRTVADESKDQPATDSIMGHARDDMASVYRERISDERLANVAEYVRAWLFAVPQEKIDVVE